MIPPPLILSFILLIPLFIGAGLILFLWKKRDIIQDNTAIIFISGVIFGECLYTATYSNELLLPDSAGLMVLVFIQYCGMLIFMISMMGFALWYVGFWTAQTRLLVTILSFPGIFSLLLIVTNSYHHLFYQNIIHITNDLPHFVYTEGFFYMPIQVYALFLLILINGILIYWMISSPRSYGYTIWLIIIGALAPMVGLILYLGGVRPYGFINFVPFSLIISATVLTAALVKYRLYALKPIAYRNIFNEIPAGILLIDEYHKIIEINYITLCFLNLTGPDIFNKSLENLLPDHPIIQFLKNEGATSKEITERDKFIFLTKKIITGVKGEIIGTLVLFTDITRQKADEQAILQNELILRSTFDSTTDGILIVNRERRILTSNTRFYEIWKISKEHNHYASEPNFLKSVVNQVIDPVSFVEDVEELSRGTKVSSVELHLTDGRVLERYSAPLIISGELTGRIWTFHDITELKQKEQSLQESEARYKHLLDNAPDLIWQLDNEGTFTYISPSWTRILGYAVQDVVGKNFRDIVHPDDIPLCEQYLSNSIQKLEKRQGIEYRVKLADGSWHWHHGSLIISFGIDKQISVIGTSRDINDLKIAEKSLKNANRQLNLLTSITRHDILNAVMAMNAYLEFGMEIEKSAELEKIFKKFEQLIPIIQRDIEFTRVYEVLGSHEPTWQNIGLIIHKKRSSAKITISDEIEDFEIYADPMLERVFDNLLENSIRHGEHVTEINLSCKENQGDLEIVYTDNGTGIQRDEKNRIFNRGFGKNTGMGLFLVREILQLSGISISETGDYSSGARFEILVPAESYRRTKKVE